MIYRFILLLLAAGATVVYFLAPSVKKGLGWLDPDSARIIFFHVPEAMLCSLFFLWGAIMAARYLLTRKRAFDRCSLASIEVGVLLCLLATLTGMVFARQQWGVAWDWDPRQTSILTQLLIYSAYFALRFGFTSRERAAANAGAYAIFAFLTVPFLIWIFPRIVPTKHGGANTAVVGGELNDLTYYSILYGTVFVIGLVSIWCYKLRVREMDAKDRLEELDEHDAGDSDTADTGVVRPVRIRDSD